MYTPYSSATQKNKNRLYVILFLIFVGLILYWRYSSPQKQKGTFQSAGENIDGAIQNVKDKVGDAKNKVGDAADAAKDTVKKAADAVEQAAADAKKKL
jgi:F0F1-type ATP synthase membrane subunit b/b'